MAEERSTVRQGYEDLGDAYARNRSVADRERDLLTALSERLDPDALVLDAGCGPGTPAAVLARDNDVVGLDLAREQLRLARQRALGSAVQGDLLSLPVRGGAVGGVVSLHALIHISRERHDEVLAEFRRVLDTGGWLLVSSGANAWEGRADDWLGDVPMWWSYPGRERTLELVTDAGFEVERVEEVDDGIGDGAFLFVLARRQ